MRTLTRRQQLSASILAVLALLFISLDFAGGSFADARGGVTGTLGALYRGTDAVLGPARRFVQGVPDVAGNRARIARLQQQNADLRRQLDAARTDQDTAATVRRLQLQATAERWRVLPARVIGTQPGAGFQWTVTVDVGSGDRVTVGQTVTDGAGLVGRVVQVHATSSVVLLAADPNSGVGVRDSRSGQLLLASGHGGAGLVASPLGDGADLRAGDKLVTGPAGATTYAPGLTVGTVTAVRTSAGGAVSAVVRPVADFGTLDLVGIVSVPTRTTARSQLGSGG